MTNKSIAEISGSQKIRRITIGSFEVTTITDGVLTREGPHPTFGADQSPETVAALMAENHLPTNTFMHAFTPTLINTGTELVLFDTGFGAMGHAQGLGQLRTRLTTAGYTPDDVTIVVLTHMHIDHISGLMDNDAPAFPNARYFAGAIEYDFWTSSDREGTPAEQGHQLVLKNVVPLADKTTFIGDGAAIVPGITAMSAFGHTPGHLAFHIESDNARLMLTADAANHFVASLQKPDWHVGFDFDKDQAAATRRRLFGMIAADNIPFIGHHMPPPAIGYAETKGDGFRFVPIAYQFDM